MVALHIIDLPNPESSLYDIVWNAFTKTRLESAFSTNLSNHGDDVAVIHVPDIHVTISCAS